jgi:2-iminobutanoate/2-iminopropanoate deaminase
LTDRAATTEAPEPIGLYSNAVRVPVGAQLLAVAGQLAVGPSGASVGEGDFRAQFTQVFDNMRAVLARNGANLADVVKFTTYLVDADDVARFYEVRAELFPEWFPDGRLPANTLLVVQRLVRPEFLIEVEALAAVGS